MFLSVGNDVSILMKTFSAWGEEGEGRGRGSAAAYSICSSLSVFSGLQHMFVRVNIVSASSNKVSLFQYISRLDGVVGDAIPDLNRKLQFRLLGT